MKIKYLLVFPAFFLLVSFLFIRVLEPFKDKAEEQGNFIIPDTGQIITAPSPRKAAESHPLYWLDEFEVEDPRWDWEYNQGTGEKELIQLPGGNPGVKIWIEPDTNPDTYSDCSLREISENYEFGVIEARLRLTDDNGLTDGGKGTRGWGFWDGNLEVLNVAWFWSASPESHPDISGFRVMVIRNSEFLLNQEISIDMREWHTYRVELTSEGVRFYVDGVEIAATQGRPANQQRIELWVDNMAVQINNETYSREYLDLNQDQAMYIDWVEYRYSPLELNNHLFLPWIGQ